MGTDWPRQPERDGSSSGHVRPTEGPRSVDLLVAMDEAGLAEVREFTRRTLADWALDHRSDDAVTVVTELTANALVHAAADETNVWLRLSRRAAHVVCAVTDHSDQPPVYPHAPDPLAEHGRGLRIIEALSEHWGWTRRTPGGKTVWAMLPARP
ncbi:ATP-binding protein [Streptomyces sp. V3I7]|uniref:ATP-binding protein n=1 Tax=Streptomyces sp. V3I7 TaxID=3042278 RepID=UPI002788F87A|nr:ATP-binding protein [Streptomyces sp. V3I7]MDQ0994581.1 anti-sigma regulatory factor (Ser/Thr protein kinase) [Streptomyces sp. V3I7]